MKRGTLEAGEREEPAYSGTGDGTSVLGYENCCCQLIGKRGEESEFRHFCFKKQQKEAGGKILPRMNGGVYHTQP